MIQSSNWLYPISPLQIYKERSDQPDNIQISFFELVSKVVTEITSRNMRGVGKQIINNRHLPNRVRGSLLALSASLNSSRLTAIPEHNPTHVNIPYLIMSSAGIEKRGSATTVRVSWNKFTSLPD